MKSIAYYLLIVPLTVLEFLITVLVFPCTLVLFFQMVVQDWRTSLQDPTERSDVGSWEREGKEEAYDTTETD